MLLATLGFAVDGAASPAAQAGGEADVVRGSRAQLRDAWLASDAVVVGVYAGSDSNLGPRYHNLRVQEVWLGTPAPGSLVFKAPRGIRTAPGSTVLLFLWDRLAGVFDAYLDESRRRHGDGTWAAIGPDSITVYALPFAGYAYPFDGDELRLRGRGAFTTRIARHALRDELEKFEATLRPEALCRNAALCVRARVDDVQPQPRRQDEVVVESRIAVRFAVLETFRGTAPDSLHLDYVSFPRAPRFVAAEEVVLFLADDAGRWYLPFGKRSVLHLQQGEVLETGQPLSELRKTLGGTP